MNCRVFAGARRLPAHTAWIGTGGASWLASTISTVPAATRSRTCRADARMALVYWPWSLLAQPAPLPERMLRLAAEAVVDGALDGWGPASDAFEPAVRAAYAAPLRDPTHAHAICEEYRAAATLDREHDALDRAERRRIRCPTLVLWGRGGPLDEWYADAGGPLDVWKEWCDEPRGHPVDGGHFFPETRRARHARSPPSSRRGRCLVVDCGCRSCSLLHRRFHRFTGPPPYRTFVKRAVAPSPSGDCAEKPTHRPVGDSRLNLRTISHFLPSCDA
jgi:hypothetical protein